MVTWNQAQRSFSRLRNTVISCMPKWLRRIAMKFSTNIAAVATLLLSSSVAVAQVAGSPPAQDDSMQGAAGTPRDVEALTDSQMGAGTSTLSDLSAGPKIG